MRSYLNGIILTIILLSNCISARGVSSGGSMTQVQSSDSVVSFVTVFDINTATKDGYYLNGYVVTIDHKQAEKINGRKIKVSGEVTIEKGLDHQPVEYDKAGNKIISQGREQDTKHIVKPSIEILK